MFANPTVLSLHGTPWVMSKYCNFQISNSRSSTYC